MCSLLAFDFSFSGHTLSILFCPFHVYPVNPGILPRDLILMVATHPGVFRPFGDLLGTHQGWPNGTSESPRQENMGFPNWH